MSMNREQLISSFEELYLIEKKAHDLYESKLEESLSDRERDAIQGIHDDEKRHMEIVQKIIKLIQGPEDTK